MSFVVARAMASVAFSLALAAAVAVSGLRDDLVAVAAAGSAIVCFVVGASLRRGRVLDGAGIVGALLFAFVARPASLFGALVVALCVGTAIAAYHTARFAARYGRADSSQAGPAFAFAMPRLIGISLLATLVAFVALELPNQIANQISPRWPSTLDALASGPSVLVGAVLLAVAVALTIGRFAHKRTPRA